MKGHRGELVLQPLARLQQRPLNVEAGVIDREYAGNVQILLFNHGKKDYCVKRGDRFAQRPMKRVENPPIQAVTNLFPLRNHGFPNGAYF